jgi:hypothetical protein
MMPCVEPLVVPAAASGRSSEAGEEVDGMSKPLVREGRTIAGIIMRESGSFGNRDVDTITRTAGCRSFC